MWSQWVQYLPLGLTTEATWMTEDVCLWTKYLQQCPTCVGARQNRTSTVYGIMTAGTSSICVGKCRLQLCLQRVMMILYIVMTLLLAVTISLLYIHRYAHTYRWSTMLLFHATISKSQEVKCPITSQDPLARARQNLKRSWHRQRAHWLCYILLCGKPRFLLPAPQWSRTQPGPIPHLGSDKCLHTRILPTSFSHTRHYQQRWGHLSVLNLH